MRGNLAVAAFAAAVALGMSGGSAGAQQTWNMQSTYPGSLPILGTAGKWFAERIGVITDGEIRVDFQEPGALVPALQVFDAVASGAVEAGWSSPGYWAGRAPALQLFGAVPFGPRASEYLAWYKFGGGEQLFHDIYHKYGIHSVICAVLPPEASGWFRQPIESVEDLQGLKMRFYGLGAKVMEELGVSTQLLAGGDVFPALELGTIDAAEFSMPALDLNLGFYQVAKHYYFPGWHQQSSLIELMINLDLWNSLDETAQMQIETVCEAAITRSIAEGEAIQVPALEELEANGVTIHEWGPEIMEAYREAWEEVAAEQQAADEDFARVWESYSSFRDGYNRWQELGYLDD